MCVTKRFIRRRWWKVLLCILLVIIYKFCKSSDINDGSQDSEEQKRIQWIRLSCSDLKTKILEGGGDGWIQEYLAVSPYDLMSLFKPPSLKVVHVNKKHHIASCVPYKSGSESARYLISSLSDGEQEEIKTMEELQDFTKIIQVREPFERLLSAYRFTFEKSETLGFGLSRFIMDKFPHLPSAEKEDGTQIPSFQQFIEYIGVGFSKHGMDKDLYISGAPLHWVPQYMQCNPCSTQYNPKYLIKLESWIHDTTLLLDSKNITTDRTFYLLNSTPGGHSSDLKLLKQYYSKISGKQMDRIYFHYRPDFLLFNYTYSQFKEKLSTP